MTPLGTAEPTKVGPTFDQSAESAFAAEALIKEARRLQRRRWLFGGFLMAVLLGLVLFGILISKGGTPSERDAPAKVAGPSRPAASHTSDATTAYVVDAAGLVPVNLATHRAGQAIRIAGFSFSGSYSNVAMAPDGKFAYVVTSPNPPHAGHALPGPALVSDQPPHKAGRRPYLLLGQRCAARPSWTCTELLHRCACHHSERTHPAGSRCGGQRTDPDRCGNADGRRPHPPPAGTTLGRVDL